jgi:hypothetical protein
VIGDYVLLARVLHDWDDRRALQILNRARAALNENGEVIVFEMLLDETSASGAQCDLHLLAVTGGRERTKDQYLQLCAGAGLHLAKVAQGPGLVSRLHFTVAD